jgi:hypothetical protein
VSAPDELQAIADALAPLTGQIDGLQIVAGWTNNPTPPAIDVYPDTPFQIGSAFGVENKWNRWIVRARVTTIEPAAATLTLLRLLDVTDPASVEAALAAADFVLPNDGSVSGFEQYGDDPSRELLGVTWKGLVMNA